MRIITTILLLISFKANATNFFVKNAGSDAGNGLTNGTAWQTFSKLNVTNFSPGDTIFLNGGDSWNEPLRLLNSGSIGNPIVITSYGIGKANITGFQPLTGWVNIGGNIWQATATNSVPYLNTVLIGGTIRAKGRYPNSTFLTSSCNLPCTTASQIATSLTGTPDYTGAEAVVRSQRWITDVVKIVSQSGGNLNFYPTFTGVAPNTSLTGNAANNTFFIQNSILVLDVQNEWCYDSASKVITVYSTTSPTVQYSSIDTLVYLQNKNYITFDGLNFTGSNNKAIRFDTCHHLTIQNCSFNNNGMDAIFGRASDYAVIENDSIVNSLNDGITTLRDCDWIVINNNYVKNSGVLDGMSANGNGAAIGIFAMGVVATITNNTVDSCGYNGIYWAGINSLIEHNLISNGCYRKDDGANLYTFGSTGENNSAGSLVRNNIILNGIGQGGAASTAACVYLDGSNGITVENNTLWNGSFMAFFQHSSNNIKFNDNTIIDSFGRGTYIMGNSGSVFEMKRNIFYAKSSSWEAAFLQSIFPGTVAVDSNYYLRPISEGLKMRVAGTNYSLSGWTGVTGWDTHSQGTPSGIANIYPLIYYNATLSSSVVPISGRYIDAKGTAYINSITLQPFQSKILFYATIQPNTPKTRVGNLIFY